MINKTIVLSKYSNTLNYNILSFVKEWHLNPVTSCYLIYTFIKPNWIKIKPPIFALGEKVIPSVDQSKYVGIIINVKKCDAALNRQMKKYCANDNMLLRKFSYCSHDVKCCMFKSYCSPMYCFSMWFNSTVTSMMKLYIAYNNGLWRILNLPKHEHVYYWTCILL